MVAAAALLACGPPQATRTPEPADAASDEPSGPDLAAESGSAADESFRGVLAALAGGSARAVRNLVPAGGRLLLRSNICSGPLGRVRCNEREIDAERRRVDDELLGPWQAVAAEAAAADPAFASGAQSVACDGTAAPRWSCRAELELGFDPCRGDHTAIVEAVLVQDGEQWLLEQLGLSQEILVCQ